MSDPLYSFEAEHIFAQELYKDSQRAAFLNQHGYKRDMLGNLMGLYSDPAAVAHIQSLPDGHPLKAALLDRQSGFGTVWHRGGSTSTGGGGFQAAKNAFLIEQVDRIRRAGVSEFAQKAALDNLFDWTWRLGKGEILGPDGKPLGVMGDDLAFQDRLTDTFETGDQAAFVDPSEYERLNPDHPSYEPNHPDAQAAREALNRGRDRFGSLDLNDTDAASGKNYANSTHRRGKLAELLISAFRRRGVYSADQYNDAVSGLGSGKDAAKVRNSVIIATTHGATATGAWSTLNGEFVNRGAIEGRAAMLDAEQSRNSETATNFERFVAEQTNQTRTERAESPRFTGPIEILAGPDAVRLGGRSVTRMSLIGGVGGGVIGDVAEYINVSYDSIKKGILNNDWGDFFKNTAAFGASVVISSAAIATSIVVAGAVAGPVGAAVVGAAWAAYGIYDALSNGWELINKIAADVGLREAIEAEGLADPGNLFTNGTSEQILVNAVLGRLGAPTIPNLELLYQIDDRNPERADRVTGTARNELFYVYNGGKVNAGAGFDEIYHHGYGEAHGEGDNDVVIGVTAKVLPEGSVLDPLMQAAADARRAENARIAAENVVRAREGLLLLEMLPALPDSPRAAEDIKLLLDGGAGNDIVLAMHGGNKAITVGGLGRDWIYNASKGGELYGDTRDGLYERQKRNAQGELLFDEAGRPVMETVPVEDSHENADNFWFHADTAIMDAQHFDVLKYYGIPLTGGDANGGLAGFAILNGLFGAAIGLANLTRYATGYAQDWTDEVYVDHLQPWMLYTFERDEDGNLDMLITNAFEQIFRGMMAALDLDGGAASESIHKGWMRIENVDVVGSRLGILQREAAETVLSNGKKGGSLGMVFRAVNPLQVLLPILNVVPGVIGQALYYTVMADALISSVEAASRFAKMMDWAEGTDPLVIDLDGDGIETVGRENSRAYFDVDGDMFRESTGCERRRQRHRPARHHARRGFRRRRLV